MLKTYFSLIITFVNYSCIFSQMEKPIQLQEIVITKSKINALDLGIISKPVGMKLTRTERHLQEAKSGIMNLVINSFNGKIEMLKKEIIIDKNEKNLEKLATIFEDEYYLKILKIPLDYIRSFQYYIIENIDFCSALDTNEKELMMFIMTKLALDFNEFNNK